MQNTLPHRIWAEIDLDNLVHNFRVAQSCAPHNQVICVIKADAYGHGAVPCARALAAAGAAQFSVATAEEALQLRRHGITQPILLLGAALPTDIPNLAAHKVDVTVSSLAAAKAYAEHLNGLVLGVHIKVDTGMSRLGVSPMASEEVLAIAQVPGLRILGLYTHFTSADEPESDEFTRQQAALFAQMQQALQERGLAVPLYHLANSAAVLRHPGTHADAVRPGIMLYGSNPFNIHDPAPLKPVMSLRTRIMQLHHLQQGQAVSYGRTWQAPRPSTVATLGIGYADGLFRALSGKINMLVRGQPAPQLGRICMDMTILDVTGLDDIHEGDTVTVFGADGDARITADEIADTIGTISYEVFCAVAARVPRLYYRGGELVKEICYTNNF